MINDFNNPDRENLNESNEHLSERLDDFQESLYDSEYSDLQGVDKLKIQEGAVDELSKMRKAVTDKAKEAVSNTDIKKTVSEFSKKFDESRVIKEAGAEITEYTNKLGDTQTSSVKYSDYTTESYLITDGTYKGMTRPERLDTSSSEFIENNSNIIGEPLEDIKNHHKQETSNSCAVACSEFVIESLTDIDVDEAELREVAKDYGYTDNGQGTPFYNIGKISECYGLQSEFHSVFTGDSLTLDDAMERIENGEKIIAGVDSSMLYYPEVTESPFLPFFTPSPDHAVEIIGFDKSNPDDIKVIINDPGFEDGAGNVYSWDDFKNCSSSSFVSIHK